MKYIILIILISLLVLVLVLHNRKSIPIHLQKEDISITYVKEKPIVKKKIPLILHQTWDSISEGVLQNISDNLTILTDKVEYRFYDDKDCWQYIKDNFPPRVLLAYEKINPQAASAMRSDLWRYCVMYKDGGLYLDIKSTIKQNPFKNLQNNDNCIMFSCGNKHCGEHYRMLLDRPHYEQWALLTAPRHPIMKEAIDKCVDNILNEYNGPVVILRPGEVGDASKYSKEIWANDAEMELQLTRRKSKVMWISGPDMLSEAVYNSNNTSYEVWPIERFFDYKFREYLPEHLYKDMNNHYAYNNKSFYYQ